MKLLFHRFCGLCVFFAFILPVGHAKEMVGVTLQDKITFSPGGQELTLNSMAFKASAKQIFYVAGLYLQNGKGSLEQIFADEGAKRFVIFCQNQSVKPGALIRALNLGIISNHSEQELTKLAPKLQQFIDLWNSQISAGDQIWIDYLPAKGSQISINGVNKGIIVGKEFYDAFLKSWLGDKPLNASMKKQLLGRSS